MFCGACFTFSLARCDASRAFALALANARFSLPPLFGFLPLGGRPGSSGGVGVCAVPPCSAFGRDCSKRRQRHVVVVVVVVVAGWWQGEEEGRGGQTAKEVLRHRA